MHAVTKSDLTTLTHWVDGKAVSGDSGRYGDIYNPATGAVQARVPYASEDELGAAVAAAKAAFPAWAAMPALRRARIMFRLKALLEERMDDLAAIITREHGKVFDDARGEVQRRPRDRGDRAGIECCAIHNGRIHFHFAIFIENRTVASVIQGIIF